jgi:hypothetical protein
VETAPDFATARLRLAERTYDWLVTNVRLGEYNGLHLIHLVTSSLAARRVLVYDEHADAWLAREAQRIGAFYERGDRVAHAIAGYLRDTLPAGDRRAVHVAPPSAPSSDPIVVTYRVEHRPVADFPEP